MTKKQDELKVKVILTEELLKKEPELSKVYDQKKGEVVYVMPKTITTEFKEEVTNMISEIRPSEVAVFNPLVFTLIELHEFREWKPEKDATEKQTEERFQEANKVVRSFNASLKKVKAEMKKPYTDINKKIETVFKMLEEEVKITDSALSENFKEHLEAKEEKKRLAEEKKKAAELAKINELQAQNDEISEKAKNQEIDNAYLSVISVINGMVSDVSARVFSSNEDGLKSIKSELDAFTFLNIQNNTPNFNLIPEEKVKILNEKFTQQLQISKKVVDDKIEFNRVQKENEEKAKQQEILQAQNEALQTKNESLQSAPDDLPFFVQENKPDLVNMNELEKFRVLSDKIHEFLETSKRFQKELSEIPFEMDFTKDVHKKLVDNSFSQIIEWSSKMDIWMNKQFNSFSNWYEQNKTQN